MSTSGLAGVPSFEKGEGSPACSVRPFVVADAECGKTKRRADSPSDAMPTRRRPLRADQWAE
jgi:hypothetical protein